MYTDRHGAHYDRRYGKLDYEWTRNTLRARRLYDRTSHGFDIREPNSTQLAIEYIMAKGLPPQYSDGAASSGVDTVPNVGDVSGVAASSGVDTVTLPQVDGIGVSSVQPNDPVLVPVDKADVDVDIVPVLAGVDIASMSSPPDAPNPILKLACDLRKPGSYIGIIGLVLYASVHRVRISLFLANRCIDVLQTWLPSEIDRMGGYADADHTIHVAACAVGRDESTKCSGIVKLPACERDLLYVNHWTPLAAFPPQAAQQPHANCTGLMCGGVGYPCISAMTESLAPAGFVPWPVPGDGDCLLHALLWTQGLTSAGLDGLALRCRTRVNLADFLLARAGDPDWRELVHVLEGVPDDAPCDRAKKHFRARASGLDSDHVMPVEPDADDAEVPPPLLDVSDDEVADDTAAPSLIETSDDDDDLSPFGLDTSDEEDERVPSMLDATQTNTLVAWSRLGGSPARTNYHAKQHRGALHISKVASSLDELQQQSILAQLNDDIVSSTPDREHASLALAGPMSVSVEKRSAMKVSEKLEWTTSFDDFLTQKGLSPKLKRLPRGLMDEWWSLRASGPIKQKDKMKILRARKLRIGKGVHHNSTAKRVAKNTQLGRNCKAPTIQRALFQWFLSIRGSVKGRIPLRLLHAQGVRIMRQYIRSCLLCSVRPDPPCMTNAWYKRFREKYHISLRLPNKRWKVPFAVFLERCGVLWRNVIRVTIIIQLLFGYTPEIDGWDQKPFHMNESGSKYQRTLSFKGGSVGLSECHSATRQRWTSSTFTTSSLQRARAIPPLEVMMKGGQGVHQKLLDALTELRASGVFGSLTWLSVATSPSGSYNTEDVHAFLDRHLELMTPGRHWRIIMADDYSAHKADCIWDLCWERGYVLVLFGGGCTGALQICDTHLHFPLSTQYQEAEMAHLLEQSDRDPKALPVMDRADCLREVTAVYSQPSLHEKVARRGCVDNMFLLPLDGSQDHMGKEELQSLWKKLDIPTFRRQCLAAMEQLRASGDLRWTSAYVREMLEPFQRRGHIDEYLEGMDDEGASM